MPAEKLSSLHGEQARLDKDRETFESTRSGVLAELTAERGELSKAVEEFERLRDETSARLHNEKTKVRSQEVENDKLKEDLVQQKWKLVRERKHYDEERKQLGRNLAKPILEAIDHDVEHAVISYIPNTAESAFFGLVEGFECGNN